MESRVTGKHCNWPCWQGGGQEEASKETNEGKLTHYAGNASCHIPQRTNKCSFVDTQGK